MSDELKLWCERMAKLEGDSEVGAGIDLTRRVVEMLADNARLKARVAELEGALSLAEVVYRKNCVAEGEPSSVLDAMQKALSGDGSRVLAVMEAAQPIFEDIREIVGGWQGNPAYERHPPELGVTIKTNAGVVYAISDALDQLYGDGDG